jgi:YVTN family beta-propeller protein
MRRLELLLVVLCIAGCTALVPGEEHPTFAPRLVAIACPAASPSHIVKASVPGRPFEALSSRNGRWVFVSLMPATQRRKSRAGGGGIGVLRWTGTQLVLKRVVRLPPIPAGMALSRDGRLLVVADGRSVDFLDVSRLVSGVADPILGSIRDAEAPGSVYVGISRDDRTLFVSNEAVRTVTVIDLQRARLAGFHQNAIVGNIPTGTAPVGLAFSQDGRYLFITSEFWRRRRGWPVNCHVPRGFGPAEPIEAGAVEVVDISRARERPMDSVIGLTPAGCMPVRAVVSPDGVRLYLTARGSNTLLAFDTAHLLSDPTHALVATVPVGTAPVGLAVVQDGRRIVVANSSRFGGRGGEDLTVIDASKIGEGRAAVIGTIPTGEFPRELHRMPGKQVLLLTDTNSAEVELIPIACFGLSGASAPEPQTRWKVVP